MTDPIDKSLGIEDLRWLQRLARSLVQDPNDADDAVQETLVVALTRHRRTTAASGAGFRRC